MKRSLKVLAVFVAWSALGWQPAASVSPAMAQTPCLDFRDYPSLETTLDLPGQAYRMATAGSYLFVAGGASGLQVVDIQDISAPVKVGSYNSPGQARGVTVVDDLLYLGDGDQGLRILDVSNPPSPQLVGAVNTLGFVHEVVVTGGLAYLAAAYGSGGLIIADVSDPAAPTVLSTTSAGGDARSLVVRNGHAYVADFTGKVYVFDVTDPSSPVEVDQVTTISEPTAIALSGGHLVVSCHYRGIQMFGLTDPAHPQLVSAFGPDQGLPFYYGDFVSCDGTSAAVAGTDYEVTLIDLANPAAPAYDRTFDLNHGSPKILLTSGTLFAAFVDDGLEIKSREGWGLPTPIGAISPNAEVSPGPIAVYSEGGYEWALVASYSSGVSANKLHFVNLNNENFYSVSGWVANQQRLYDVVIQGHYAYAAFTWQLLVIDISDPTNPLIAAEVPIPTLRRLAVDGDLLYCGASDVFQQDTRVLDISDPTAPVTIDELSHEGTVTGLAFSEDRLYVTEESRLYTYDRTDPAHPVYLNETTLTDLSYQPIQDIAVRDNWLFVCVEEVGVQIRNRNYVNMPQVAMIPLPDARDIIFDGNLAYVSDLNRGLTVVDITSPVHPEILGYKNGQARAALVHGDRLLVSGQGFILGLESVPLQCDLLSPVSHEVPVVSGLELSAAPNPFNPRTTIRLALDKEGPVDLDIYDLKGRKVRQMLAGKWMTRGKHWLDWNGRDDQGRQLPSGAYFLLIRADGKEKAETVTLLK